MEINSLPPKEAAAGPSTDKDRQVDCQDGGKNGGRFGAVRPVCDGEGGVQVMAFANGLRTIYLTDQNSKTATCSPSN